MNTSTQNIEVNGIVQPSDDSSSIESKLSGSRHGPVSHRLMIWLAGLVCLLLATSAVRADRVPANCNGSGLGISLFTSIPDVHVGDTLFYSINVFNGTPNSGRIVCDATGIQAFIVTPDGKTNVVALVRTTLHQGESDFYPDVVSYVVRAQDIQPDGTLLATARDIGVIHQNDTDSSGGGFQGLNTEVNQPCIQIAVQCLGSVGENGPITFTGTVTNCGNNTLVNVKVTNFVNGAQFQVAFITNLARGQVASFSGSWVPSNPCVPSTATFTALGTDEFTATPRTVTSSASTTCSEILTPGIRVTKSCPVGPVAPGQLLTFSGSVSNTGNVTLTNILVLNDQPASNTPVFTLASLAPGAVANFTGSYLAPTNCSVTDTLTARASSICGVGVTNTASATCPILTTPQITITAVCPATPVLPGGSLTYSGTVRNTGDVTLTNVVVISDRPAANTTVFTAATLAPGASANFTGTFTAPTNGCSIITTLSGTGRSVCTPTTATNTVSMTCNITTAPAIAVTLACPAVSASGGGSITYSGTVRNSGNVALNNVFVVINQPTANTPVIGPITLAPGAIANFTATFTAPLDACTVSSTATATGNDACAGTPVSNSASAACTLNTTPGIVVTQLCPVTPAPPGGLTIFSGTVRNSGNITLTNVVVVNNLSGATPVFTAATLAPGAVANFTGSYFTPTNCSTTSTSTATGRSICGIAVTNTVSATCPILTTPAIKVTQTCPVTSVVPGGVLTYSGTVSNAGNITLTNIIVVDNRPAANTVVFTLATLAPGATANFTGSYVTHPDCCVDSSTLKASGQGCAGVTVSDTVTRTCTLLTLPRIVVTKLCTPGVLRPGDLLTYSGTVSNAGNITLINVIVVDNQPANNTPVIGPITLAPGESVNYYGSYIVPPDFCGTDTVTASGLDLCTLLPVVNSATTTCPITTTPRITVTKKCPLLPTPRGGLYTFSGSVSNSGNVTLVNVFVVDNQLTNNTPVIGPITLAPGASVNFTGSYLAPVDCCELLDTVTARGQDRCSGSNVTATASAVCPLLSTPGIAVVQNCPAAPISVGSIYTYSGYVTNTGDVVLTNVFVYGPQGTNNPVLGPIELAPGESEVYSGSYTVPLDTCSVSVTASGRDTCGGNPVTNSSSCPVSTAPAIFVTENCPPGPVTAGSTVAFGGLVSNIGNVTLTNIFVFSGQPNNTQVLGPITLAPGASAPYSGSYIATGGSNPTTNSTIVTNNSTVITTNNNVTLTTNAATATSFGTINSVSQTVVDRFSMGTNFSGLTYAGEDHGYGATELYAMRKDTTGMSFFDTIIPSTATTTDRFPATTRNFDSLAYAAPDLGFGPLQFYYLSHDNAGVSTFGTITPGGAVGVVTDRFVVGNNFDALTFSATDLGYGANLFYYVRHDATGLSTFGTINPALPGITTDRFTVGTNVDSLVFTDLVAPGYGPNRFYYVRHDANGVSTFGTIFITSPTTGAVTDRFVVGTNATELTFTATDVGFGANLFYFLRGRNPSVTTNTVTTFTTNTVTTFTTNSVVTFTPTNTVTAIGRDICQNRTVAAAANCTGPVVPASRGTVISSPTISNGVASISFSTETGSSYTLQYKNRLNDPVWTNLQTVAGTGGTVTLTDSTAAGQPTRFYRVVSTP